MNEKEYLDRIFCPYVQSQELLELKEEIANNLHESIIDNLKEGMNHTQAFKKSVEDLGDMEQILSSYPKKRKNVWKLLSYVSMGCILIGLCIALITFIDYPGWNGAFLALGTLYPFCIVQTAYLIWYKAGKAGKNLWSTILGIASCIAVFFVVNIVESSFRSMYYYGTVASELKNISAEIVLAVAALGVMLYAMSKERLKSLENRH